jgi:hypothetical protein
MGRRQISLLHWRTLDDRETFIHQIGSRGLKVDYMIDDWNASLGKMVSSVYRSMEMKSIHAEMMFNRFMQLIVQLNNFDIQPFLCIQKVSSEQNNVMRKGAVW